jgi:putative Mg2+ transporter-C (MgtC) family protein
MMPLTVTSADLAVRLLSTAIAGAVIGYNRGEQGKSAGLRTTLLVCLAASFAMLQVNELLDLSGRATDSFVMNDLMRLPLGILTGVGFIGAGAILRRRDLVVGVTTAATLWYVTVIGLCFGGGQILLGWVATAAGCLVLWGLRWVENFLPEESYARLTLTLDGEGPSENQIVQRLAASGIEILNTNIHAGQCSRRYTLNVRERRRSTDRSAPAFLAEFERQSGVVAIDWQTMS